MQIKILFVERKFHDNFSLERVFRQVAKSVSKERFATAFEQVKFLSTVSGMMKNLLTYKPRAADVYHITGHITYMALTLPRGKTVLTIPDARILAVRRGVRRYFIKKMFFDLPVRKAKYVTAISQTTKDEVIKFTGCAAEKVRVIEVPLDESLQSGAAFEKKEFNAECPKILQVGTAPHKNIPNVIRALEGVNCELVIIGKLDAETRALLDEKNINYRNEFDLDEAAIVEHYRAADITVFCSIAEGFGLPVIEAQAMRTPVVTSDLNPMKEVAGNAALLVDPYNPSAIRAAIVKIIEDEQLRKELIANGIENIKRYHPRVIAEKYEDLYKEIFKENQI